VTKERTLIVLYEWADCWKCVEVREALERLGLPYRTVELTGNPAARELLTALTGMPFAPVLIDGETVIWDRRRIIRHLEETHGGLTGAPELPTWMGGVRALEPEEADQALP
jgi:glutathione S-transferase